MRGHNEYFKRYITVVNRINLVTSIVPSTLVLLKTENIVPLQWPMGRAGEY